MGKKKWEPNDDDGECEHGNEWECWQVEAMQEEAVDDLLASLGPEDAYLKLPTVERAYRYRPPSIKWMQRYN